jgi:hypothetical protein
MILLLLMLYSIVYSILLLIKTLPAGKQSLLLSFKTQVILLKTFPNEMRCILYRVAKMIILTKFREIRDSRQNIFNSAKVFAIISLLFLFPRQLSRQKSISYKYFYEIFQKNKKISRKSGKISCHQIVYTKMEPFFPMLQTSLDFFTKLKEKTTCINSRKCLPRCSRKFL